jgi:hypothetical protein
VSHCLYGARLYRAMSPRFFGLQSALVLKHEDHDVRPGATTNARILRRDTQLEARGRQAGMGMKKERDGKGPSR